MTTAEPREVMLPQSPATEQALIGAILVNPDSFREVRIDPEDFYIQRNRWIWEAIGEIARAGNQPDYVTVAANLDGKKQLGEIGGSAYLTGLITACPNAFNAAGYADLIRDLSYRRRVILGAQRLANTAYDRDSDLRASLSAFFETMTRGTSVNGAAHISQVTGLLYDEIEAALKDPKDLYGVPTGFADWDKITHGLQYGTVTLLTGEPGIGKSVLAAQVVNQAAAAGYPAAYYSLEMSARQVVRRLLSAQASVPTHKIRSGRMTDGEVEALVTGIGVMSALPVYIGDDSAMSTMDLRIDLQRLTEKGVRLAVIDYEALLSDAQDMPDNERSTIISKRVHAIAKDLDIAILSVGDMVKSGMTGERKGQAAAAGSGKSLHDRDEIIIMRRNEGNENLVDVRWEKLREGDGSRIMQLVKRLGYPAFGSLAKGARA